MVCLECGVDEIWAKGLCRSCYGREWYKNNTEKVRQTNKEWKQQNKEKHKEHSKRYYENNKEKVAKYRKNHYKKRPKSGSQICKIIKKHHDDMKDDPESMSTEFIQKMIGVDCDN